MRKAMIDVTLNQANFHSEYDIDESTKEYEVADEAYRLALLFAETQTRATYGRMIPMYEFAEVLRSLDYTYEIKEV